MKPHPIIRKTIKWGGAVVTVLLVVVWVGSVIATSGRLGARWDVRAERGGLFLDWSGSDWPTDWQEAWCGWVPLSKVEIRLWPRGQWDNVRRRIEVPLWIPCLTSMVLAGSAWRLDTLARRRARNGFCPKCDYDRTGLAIGAVCPECGADAVARLVPGRSPDRQ